MTENIIKKYADSVRKKRIARYTIISSIIAVILIFSLMFYGAAKSFASTDIKIAFTELQKRMEPMAGRYLADLPKITGKLLPVYSKALEDKLSAESDNIQSLIHQELLRLDEVSAKRMPEFQKELQKLVDEQEVMVVQELTRILGPDVVPEKIERIASYYRLALEAKLAHFIDNTLKEHLREAEEIKNNAAKLAQDYKDDPVDTQEGLGIVLETIGNDLQEKNRE